MPSPAESPSLHAVAQMQQAERAFADTLATFPGRNHGLKPTATRDKAGWKIIATPPALPPLCYRQGPTPLSGHAKLAFAALAAQCAPLLTPVLEALGALHPFFGLARLEVIVPMDGEGVLYAPSWNLAGYALRQMLQGPAAGTPMRRLLDDLATEPHPTGVFTIGNKVLHAAGPRSALAIHLRLKAPKSPAQGRRAPTHVPTIHQIWSPPHTTRMGEEIVAEWAARAAPPAGIKKAPR